MKIAVVGLWHLGCVTAACLADAGHDVVGYDEKIGRLIEGIPPLFEPELEALTKSGIASRKLRFSYSPNKMLDAELVWITYDTPVDENDVADVAWVKERIAWLFPYLPEECTVAISSQVPVGTTAEVEAEFRRLQPGRDVGFAYVPENLRLGKAIECFRKPERIVVGSRENDELYRIEMAMTPVLHEAAGTESFEYAHVNHKIFQELGWPKSQFLHMSPESAEMSKHAINAFLATQIALTNEIAQICELVGADARDVEMVLRTEPRIGPKAFVKAGAAFAGGTLARDLNYLHKRGSALAGEVYESNADHACWSERKIGEVSGKTIAVWGLAYKSGTDTLRRSATVDLVEKLRMRGATIRIHDTGAGLSPTLAIEGADALVIGNESPEFRAVPVDDIVRLMRRPLVIDPGGFLDITDPRVEYVVVGRGKPRVGSPDET